MRKRLWLRPRWQKVWADLWSNKLRTLLVVISISVGVFAVGMVYSSYLLFSRDLAQSWKTSAPADGTLYADAFEEELVEGVRSLRDMQEAEGRRNIDLRGRPQGGEWHQMYLTAIADYNKQKVNLIRSEGGEWPPKSGNVLLERSSAAEWGLGIGSWLEVETANGKKRLFKVSGLVYDASQTPTLFSGRGYGYISMDSLEKLEEERKLDQVNFKVKPALISQLTPAAAVPKIEAAGRAGWNKLEQGDTMVYWLQVNTPGKHPLQSIIDALMLLLGVLGVLSLVLGSLLLINTIAAIMTQQLRQIGIMKAMGGQRQQIMRLYLALVGAYGLLALTVAAPLGALAAYGVTTYLAKSFNFTPGGLDLPPQVLLLEAVVALLVPMAAALVPIWRGSSITVREAISDYGLGGMATASRTDRWVNAVLGRLPSLSRPVILSLRNTFRRKGRLALTLLTLVTAGTVFMAVFSVRSSLYASLEEAVRYFQYDISVNFTQNYRDSRIQQEVLAVPGVAAAETWGFTTGRILQANTKQAEEQGSHNLFLLATPDDTTMIQPQVLSGRWLLPADESAIVINSEVLKDNPELKVGGTAIVKIGNKRFECTVVGVAKSLMTGPIGYVPYGWLGKAMQSTGKARSVQIVTQSHDNKVQSEVGRALEQHLKKNNLRVQSVEITWEQKERIYSQFALITNFLLIMAVLLAVVGALGLMGTMSLNVLERTREIGVMRAVGASSREIGKVFIVEALCIGLLSWGIGAVLAVPISALMSWQVGMLFMNTPLSFSFSFAGTAIWFLLSLGLAVVASLVPARNATQLSVRDVLSYE